MLQLFFLLFLNIAFSLEISFENFPQDYTVYEWSLNSAAPEQAPYNSSRFSRLTINIPDAFVVRSENNNSVNLLESLERWRVNTQRGSGYPYTRSDGIAQFPFYITDSRYSSDNSLPQTSRMTNYISLAHIAQRAGELTDLRFGATNGESVEIRESSLTTRLRNMKSSGGPVNCVPPFDNWSTEKCMVCNCANEAGEESVAGKKEVTQVVLRRVVHKDWRDSICGVITQRDQTSEGRTVAQFSWTYTSGDYRSHDRLPDEPLVERTTQILNECVDSSIQAIEEGPGRFDHYHSSTVRPAWYSDNHTAIGHHRFYALRSNDQTNLSKLQSELGVAQTIVRPLLNRPRSDYDEVEGETGVAF